MADRPRRIPVIALAALLSAGAAISLASPSAPRPYAPTGFVQNIGTAQSDSAGTTLPITVTTAITAGNSIILTFAMDNLVPPLPGDVTAQDSQGNSYTVDADVTYTLTVRTVILSAHNILPLADSDVITVTHPLVPARALSANEFSGLAAAGAFDQTSNATGDSTTPSSGLTPMTSQPDELLIGAIGVEAHLGITFTVGTGYSALPYAGSPTGPPEAGITIYPEYRIVSAQGSYAADGTLVSLQSWAAAITTYRMDLSTATPTDTPPDTPTPSDTPTATDTPLPSDTPTSTATDTPTPEPATETSTPTATDTPLPSDTPTSTATDTPTSELPTDTPTPSATATETPPVTDTPTSTATETGTPTETPRPPTRTPTATPSPTATVSPTPLEEPSRTPTPTVTPTASGTRTATATPPFTPTSTQTRTPTPAVRRLFLPVIGRCFSASFQGPWEVEPNGNYSVANGPLCSGQDYFGYPNDVEDWFSVYLATPGQIDVTLTGHTGGGVQLLLYDQALQLKCLDNVPPYEMDCANQPAGWYYLRIYTASGWNDTTPYTLSVSFL